MDPPGWQTARSASSSRRVEGWVIEGDDTRMDDNLEAAWADVYDATPAGWYVGRPGAATEVEARMTSSTGGKHRLAVPEQAPRLPSPLRRP